MIILYLLAALCCFSNVAREVAQRLPGYRVRSAAFLLAGWIFLALEIHAAWS
jgi:hypothetical protein